MAQAREQLIPPNTSGYFHCISRCVRRAWLCGLDPLSGKSYEHRRDWVEQRLLLLAEVFSVSIYAYAVMSNHLHVVLKVDAVAAGNWEAEEVAQRWCRVFPGNGDPKRIERRIQNLVASPHKLSKNRDRLRNLSWFMRCLNEPIARQANREDGCTGRFWEGRFKSQVLLDERALLAAMVYADLNPIRAKMTTQLKTSDHTGIKKRIHDLKGTISLAKQPLGPIAGVAQEGLSLRTSDYLALVDYTGRNWHQGKKGRIPAAVPPILKQLKLDTGKWTRQVRGAGCRRISALGSVAAMVERAIEIGRKWLTGVGLARVLASPI